MGKPLLTKNRVCVAAEACFFQPATASVHLAASQELGFEKILSLFSITAVTSYQRLGCEQRRFITLQFCSPGVPPEPHWAQTEEQAQLVPSGSPGVGAWPFSASRGVHTPGLVAPPFILKASKVVSLCPPSLHVSLITAGKILGFSEPRWSLGAHLNDPGYSPHL